MAYEVMKMEELAKGLVRVSDGYDTEMIVSSDTVNAISELTNDKDDTMLLLTYIYSRAEAYNAFLEAHNTYFGENNQEFSCSEEFMQLLITSLLSNTTSSRKFVPHEAYSADQVYDALDSLSDSDLFGDIGSQKPLDYVNNITLLINHLLHNEDTSYLTDEILDDEEVGKRKKLVEEWD